MEPINIQYRITFQDSSMEVVDLQFHPDTISVLNTNDPQLPTWAELDYQQCPHCPLDIRQYPHCPVAVRLAGIVEKFDKVASYTKVDTEVISSDRSMKSSTTAQKAVSSLFGLLMATSDCPHTAFLKPMARFHLPFANHEETIYRVSGMYLLAQFFLEREGHTPDHEFKGLQLLYENLHTVNVEMASRLQHGSTEDLSVNAIVVLDVLANVLPLAIEDELERIEKLFAPYLTSFYQEHVIGKMEIQE